MSATILPFRRPQKAQRAAAHQPASIMLWTRGAVVGFELERIGLELTPSQARAIASDLLELGADAEAHG